MAYTDLIQRRKRMKKSLLHKVAFIVLPFLMGGSLVACGGNSSSSTTPTSSEPTPVPPEPQPPTPPEDPWYVISEKAMDNFLKKIQAGGYTMVGDKQTTAVYDQNMVTWFFEQPSPYTDHVCLTVNGETFYAFIDYNLQSLEQMVFIDKKPAIAVDDFGIAPYLPTYWLNKSMSGGNIWSLWHNLDHDNPLHFSASKNSDLYATICYFCNYDAQELPSHMQDVYMDFDSEEVNVATISFKYNSGGTHELTDGKVVITFNEEVRKSDIAQAWVDDPDRTYPEEIGDYGQWPSLYTLAINSVYSSNLGYSGVEPLPYDDFFSYATKVNKDTFMYDGYVEIHDYHAGENELDDYKSTLASNGFEPTIGSSEMVWRSVNTLRTKNEYKLYSVITLKLENGLVITGTKYYTHLTFAGRGEIYNHIHDISTKFVEFEDDENITSWNAEDYAFNQYESMEDLFDYDLFIYVTIEYNNIQTFKSYLDDLFASYVNAGFVKQKYSDTYINEDTVSKSVVKLVSNSKGVAQLLFYNIKYVDPTTAANDVLGAGFPSISDKLSKITSVLEMKYYVKAIMGLDFDHYYSIGFQFSSNSELKTFVDTYISALLAAGFKKTTEELRTCRYINDDATRTVVMDYNYGSGSFFNAWFMIE